MWAICHPWLWSSTQNFLSISNMWSIQEEQERLSGLALSHLAFRNPVRGAERAIPPLTGRRWNILLALVNPAILVQTQLEKRQANSPRPGKISSLSKEFCFMPAGISCYALSFFSRMNNGQKSRGHKLETWASQLLRRQALNTLSGSKWFILQQSRNSSGLFRSPGC